MVIRSLQAAVPSDGDGSFFGRQAELRALLERLAAPPLCVTVVIGPDDCGKTKLLKRLEEIWLSNEELAATCPVFYFDLRVQLWSTPQDAADHLHKEYRTWAEKVTQRKAAGVDIALKGFSELLPPHNTANSTDLAKVMEAFCAVIDTAQTMYPVFIIDEADRLKNLETSELITFFGFFKKQNNKAHLILSSSDDFFRVWLQDMFNSLQWEPFGVGYLPEAEARKFFAGHSVPAARGTLPATFGDSDWNGIFAVCGGSPMLLNWCAWAKFVNAFTWKEAANALTSQSLCRVKLGLAATKAAMGFSGHKYELICAKIVQCGYVSLKDVLAEIYDRDKAECKDEMLAMVSSKAIHIRYVTAKTSYGDVSLSEIDDAGGEVDLVMARSPAQRAAMKELCFIPSQEKSDPRVLGTTAA